jgi:hypothetical protein
VFTFPTRYDIVIATTKKEVEEMQEIKITGNKSGLRVLIDEPPDVGLLHNDDFNVWASALDLTLSEHIQNYYKYKSRDKPKVKEGVEKM